MQSVLLAIAVIASITSLVMYALQRRTLQREIASLRSQLRENQGTARHSDSPALRNLQDCVSAGKGGPTPVALSQLAATLSAMLGRDVRLSPASEAPASEEPHHSWAQQGCVSIQNSHDLSAAKHAPQTAVSARRTISPAKREIA